MKDTIPLLNKSETETINHRIYEHNSYIEAIRKYFKMWNDSGEPAPLCRFNPGANIPGRPMIDYLTIHPMDRIGNVLSFNEDTFTGEVEINDRYIEEFKDLSSYYIQLRLLGTSYCEGGITKCKIDRVVAMELNNNQANIVKKNLT